jgi:aerobic-type carbon monoxide dehydrogenase small subunit (CoxS/CutS family)
MLVTARDIVLRLPDADEPRIRRELSGNLCRCTATSDRASHSESARIQKGTRPNAA